MQRALELAGRGLGAVWPNPAVGCVLVKNQKVIGEGWTGRGGRPHAEAEALAAAGAAARGATAYVTLEPCAHQGETGPCAAALIEAGIARVVFAVRDPDPRVSGKGAEMMLQAGIEVAEGLLAEEARQLNEGFFLRILEDRPRVLLKVATSLDGRIAARGGKAKWITGEEARAAGHGLRASSDAILVGVGTVIADDPSLTCRLPGLEDRSPVRIVLDSHLRIPRNAGLLTSADQVPTWIISQADGLDAGFPEAVKLFQTADTRDIRGLLGLLAGQGITRLMVEGGGEVLTSFLASGLVDEIAWFRSPSMIGGDGLPVFGPLGIDDPEGAVRFRRAGLEVLGDDILELLRPER